MPLSANSGRSVNKGKFITRSAVWMDGWHVFIFNGSDHLCNPWTLFCIVESPVRRKLLILGENNKYIRALKKKKNELFLRKKKEGNFSQGCSWPSHHEFNPDSLT